MAHLQYMPGDPRLVDQLVYELKSKGIFDQFRKDCISDVDTKPAYQNLRQRVENSVSTFLARQCWQPDLNKNQLREKLRKHILDGNYLEQGVERIVDQVVNPKIASVFIPQVEDLVYNYLGISRKKTPETSNGPKVEDLLPNDLEAVSPGSVNNDDKEEPMEVDKVEESNEQNDEEKPKVEPKEEVAENDKDKSEDSQTSEMTAQDSNTIDKENIPLPQEIVVENIPPPENSPPKVEIEKIELPKETSENIPLPDEMSVHIPLPDEIKDKEKEDFFKPINTDDDDSSSDSSLRRNMSPLTPIRNYNNENSYDAQQAFENDSTDAKNDDKKEPSSFRFTIEAKSSERSDEAVKVEKKDTEANLSYQFSNQVNINNFNTPLYDDSSNSHMLQIDYESDANSKVNVEAKTEAEHNSEDSKKEKKPEEKKSSHKSSHRSRDFHKHSSSSRDKKSESKQSSSRDSSRHDKSKSSKDDKSKSSEKDRSKEKDRSDKKDSKDSKDSSRHRSSHKSSHRDSKSHRSSSSHRHSSKHDDRKSSSSSSQRDKEKSSDKDRNSKDKSKDSRSSSHRSDKDKKSSSSSSKNKSDDKDKKTKKETDDHYSLSGRGNPNRRSTDRDSNDGSSSSKGSNNPASLKSSQTKADGKRSSKLDSTSTSGDSTSPSDKENIAYEIGTQARDLLKFRPIVRIDKNLETPVSSPPRLPFVPEVILKKPKIAANFEEAKKIMKMRKFIEEEQRRMNQEAALLLEFQANVRPSLSQVYSSVPGPELEFACVNNIAQMQDNTDIQNVVEHVESESKQNENIQESIPSTEPSGQDIKAEENANEEKNVKNEKIEMKNTEKLEAVLDKTAIDEMKVEATDDTKKIHTEFFEVTIITEELSDNEEIQNNEDIEENKNTDAKPNVQCDIKAKEELKYFGEHEKYDAELERAKFCAFFKNIAQKEASNKMYLINCDTYSENVFRDASKDFGEYEIVNYHRNGHLKINKPTTTIKNLNTEVTLPVENFDEGIKSPLDVFSPQKSECSFELSSDYNEKLEEMVNKTSRQEIMEIILGSTTDVPQIDYCTESNIDVTEERKRKCDDYSSINNNTCVLKIRKLSTKHITSTTTESESPSEGSVLNTRSKYLGRPARVGLPKPRRTNILNSPSSDKSVENYEQNTPVNGKIKRQKVQRYETSDLYKPKLHYLKRNNIT